jgi:membrane-bound lytic murein transglycosylase D
MKISRKLSLTALVSLAVLGCAHQQPGATDRTALQPREQQPIAVAPLSAEIEIQPVAPVAAPLIAELPAAIDAIATSDQDPVAADAGAMAPAGDDTPIIWDRIREGMTLGNHDHPGITGEVAWFQSHQAYLDRVVDRARPYMHFIVDEVQRRGMPTEIALLPVVESAFQPFAYSHGRAAGIWQFIPGTGKRFGLKQTWWYDGRRDIASSTHAALDYLQGLHREFKGDWQLALAAYNSGEGTVHRAIRENRRKGKPTDFWSLKLPRETRGYVPKLLAISAIIYDPASYGVDLKPIVDEPFLTAVDVGSQIDLDLASELAGISLEDMYRYNPAFNRWATDPDGPHALLVPIEVAEQFTERIAQLPKDDRIQWIHHKVRKGEALGSIAEHYRTTIPLIRSVNNLKGNNIRAGNTLVIPVARKELRRYSLSAEQRLATTQETPRNGHRLEYTVQEGDTLWSIASAHDVSLAQLANWNGMAPRDPLATGRQLVIWTKQGADDSLSRVSLNPNRFQHPNQEQLRQRIAYTVRSGDSLALISRKFRVTVPDLQRWNKLSKKSLLRPGQKITVYVDVTRQSGNI